MWNIMQMSREKWQAETSQFVIVLIPNSEQF